MSRSRIPLLLLLGSLLLISARTTPHAGAQELQTFPAQRSGFPAILDAGRVKFGPTTLADLNGDNRPEILVGSETGTLYALNQNGSLRWKFSVSNAINAVANTVPGLAHTNRPIGIRSAPAVADVTGDGVPEIFISAGGVDVEQTHGGVVGLSASGALLPGWPQITCDIGNRTPPPSYTPQLTCAQLNGGDGYTEGVASSPAIGDITGDGVPEVVYGAFDQLTYARSASGALLPGWPQHALDTIWSSPAIADLTGDGVNEVIIGVDAHRYRGPSWNAVFRETFDGGYLMAYRGNGSILWASQQDEVFESSPVVADVDGDRVPEIFTGSGSYYSVFAPSANPGVGRYVTSWDHEGKIRWRTALPTQVVGDVALGDLLGDSGFEVVAAGREAGKVFALDARSGALRWSSTARETFGGSYGLKSPVLGDYNGDGRDDVFVGMGWDIVVLRGTDGAQLTASNPTDPNLPSFYGAYTVDGPPAVGDLDGDCKLDVVSAAGTNDGRAQINSWRLPSSTGVASWPMLRGTPGHQGVAQPRALKLSMTELGLLMLPGQTRTFEITVGSSSGAGVCWSVSKSNLQNVSVNLSRTSGGHGDTLEVTIDPSSSGSFSGLLTLNVSGYSSQEIPISGKVVGSIERLYVPALSR